MKLTDELRKYIHREMWDLPKWKDELRPIVDRIDAEVADKQAFCDRLHEAAKNREEVTLWGIDYVALPVDADGVPILVDDKIEICGKPCRVWNLWLDSDKKWFLNCDEGDWEGDEIATLRHYYPPTVEDILMEFHERMDELGTTDQCVGSERADAVDALLRERAELVAEYAAKLRMAEREDS